MSATPALSSSALAFALLACACAACGTSDTGTTPQGGNDAGASSDANGITPGQSRDGGPGDPGLDGSTGNPGLDGSAGDDATTEPPTPTPTNGIVGPVSSVGVPWDVTSDHSGPKNGWSSEPPEIVPYPNPDGSLDVAWEDTKAPPQIIITHVSAAFAAAWHLKVHSLARLGGFARDAANGMHYLTTVSEELWQTPDPSGVQRPDIAHLVKLAPDGTEAYRTDLKTDFDGQKRIPLYSPMTFGTSRLAVGGGTVYVTFSCNTEWDTSVMARHQQQILLGIDGTTGKQTKFVGAFGHSWDQRLFYDGTSFIATSIGDAGLRGIGVAKVGIADFRPAFAVKGGDSTTSAEYQNTFSRLGDLAMSKSGYGLLFSTEETATYSGGTSDVLAPRNLAFAHVRSDFDSVAVDKNDKYDITIVDTADKNPAAQTFDVPIKDYWGTTYAGQNKGLVWLTQYTDIATEHAERPKLVSLSNGHFIALWEKWSLTAYTETFAMVLDEYGQVLVPAKSLGSTVRVHRQDSAVVLGNKAAWVIGEPKVPQLVVYTLDEALNLERHEIK